MKDVFLVSYLCKAVPTHLFPLLSFGWCEDSTGVWGFFWSISQVCGCMISHNVESGDQGENQRNGVFLFHTQMKVNSVTFIYLFSCALIFCLCSYVSIFWAPNLCWGHETEYDFKNITWVSSYQCPTPCLNLWKLPLCVSFHIDTAHPFRASSRQYFLRGMEYLFLNPWAMDGSGWAAFSALVLAWCPRAIWR